ncbi:hypothetical protein MKW98_002034 [Papaver atlanticum]|uniref:Fungal lipase-like domain-containing protein n=1 Tax=Papaver atlanticum TaxID=357466 RepID=A0AAD4T1T4_9MAGN|nr:hypothetical protein MKW98_002034 [Papaver atlanticum]
MRFDLSGPVHLTSVDWQSGDHRRTIAASLVQGVYVLEHDREHNIQGDEALAPLWWKSFNFQLYRPLVDNKDSSIFGAIYEFKPIAFNYYQAGIIPQYVVAFRGTITKKHCFLQDAWLDLNVSMIHEVHKSSRFRIAMETVQNMVSIAGVSNIWLAGHSLGSSIAMLAGKNMANSGSFLESYLFNNPFITVPIERIIKGNKQRNKIHCVSSFLKAGFTVAVKGSQNDTFTGLSAWTPNICVNPADGICSKFIRYFERREDMESLGFRGIERLAAQTSVIELLKSAFGRESQVIHLIPSAHLTINHSPSQTFMQAHGIHQWFRAGLDLQSKVYHY